MSLVHRPDADAGAAVCSKTTLETGEEQTSASGLKCCMDKDRCELVTKMRRSGTGRGRDGHEDQEMLVIMDLMCEEATEDQK